MGVGVRGLAGLVAAAAARVAGQTRHRHGVAEFDVLEGEVCRVHVMAVAVAVAVATVTVVVGACHAKGLSCKVALDANLVE